MRVNTFHVYSLISAYAYSTGLDWHASVRAVFVMGETGTSLMMSDMSLIELKPMLASAEQA